MHEQSIQKIGFWWLFFSLSLKRFLNFKIFGSMTDDEPGAGLAGLFGRARQALATGGVPELTDNARRYVDWRRSGGG